VRIVVFLALLLILSVPSAAQTLSRLRGATSADTRLIENTVDRSPTARKIADAIEASDLIVYVQLTVDLPAGRAATRLVAATDEARYLRVVIGALTHPADRGALLAHELQHVLEISEERAVRDVASLRRLYERIGEDRHARFSFETAEAREVASRVRREMTAATGGAGS
jgi:hypothetical protein